MSDESEATRKPARALNRWRIGSLSAFQTLLIAFVLPVVLLLLLLVLIGVLVLALRGGPEARRLLAPYGLLKPGMLWLALFFLAPVWSLLRISLSTKPSRFSVDYNFTWAFQNYSNAFKDFGTQFQHAFVYAAIATVLTVLIGYPLAYVIAFRGGKYKNILLGMVVIPFFTSYLIVAVCLYKLSCI